MDVLPASIALLFLCFGAFAACSRDPAQLDGDVSVNCGSAGISSAINGREWLGDAQSRAPSFLQIRGSSKISTVIGKKLNAADNAVQYGTARISFSQFSYAFRVNPGQKILRLHFNSVPYKGFNGFMDLFSVEVGRFTLLGNFSASLTAHALGMISFVKEFCLYLPQDEELNIVFTPMRNSPTHNTYAFINGIEIISVPSDLSYFHGGDVGIHVVGQKSQIYINYNTALELITRLNVRQNSPFVGDEVDHMFPMWVKHRGNKVNNSTWRIPVDVGFRYLIRLHFSDLGLKIVGFNDLIFKILINEMVAHTNVEIGKGRGENSIPWYVDYMVVVMRRHKKQVRRDLMISLELYGEFIDGGGLLAGFEVLKLSNFDDSLASPNPLPPVQDSPWTVLKFFYALDHKYATVNAFIIILSMVNIVGHKLLKIWEGCFPEEENKPSVRAQRICRRFSLDEIQLATRNFSDRLLIGRGGFGKVYKGTIDNGQTIVAIKRLKSNSSQGAREFLTEIETLSELRHYNLVSLIGYCNKHGEMILVYDYMAGGTLSDHLYKLPMESNTCSPLTWKQRLNICIGAARGLDYLHTGHGVIHRDVKPSNILLDENFIAKVSDFGLAKHEDRSKLETHVSTKVKGTRGYVDPYYINTSKLSRKSDTYAFGVVLLEILCGRPAMDLRLAEDEHILTKWARSRISEGNIHQIVSSSLRDEASEDSLREFVVIAERCLHDEPNQRPTMAQVVLQLESVLELQDNKQVSGSTEIPHVSDDNRNDLSADTGKPTMASTNPQILTPPVREQANIEPVNAENYSSRNDRRRATAYKPSRIWPWDVFWSRIKPSKNKELLLQETPEELPGEFARMVKFDWHAIASATNQFSPLNNVGRDAFGSLYKALFPTGQIAAVKRLSEASQRGTTMFKNEILLLHKLQHRNIIRILGYCIHGEERLTVYEFTENRSLNTYIAQGQHLQWAMRLSIIMGIARGVVYLHQDSRLCVIHRDLHLGNILLDAEMNPKISGFGFARIIGECESELVTCVIAGTIGYMCPEYFYSGKYSVKTDVYNFGIVVLEIINGRRNRDCMVLSAQRLWSEGRAVEVVDESVGGAFPVEEALRCIQVALLCTQPLPSHRPTMAHALKMLEGSEPLLEPDMSQWPTLALSGSSAHNTVGDTNATFEYDDTLQR